MAEHEFLLPDELGWECNDEVHKAIEDWLTMVAKNREKNGYKIGNEFRLFMTVAIAELSDDVYAIIKKYQVKEK